MVALKDLSAEEQQHLRNLSKKGRNSSTYLRGRLIKALQDAFDHLEENGKPIGELLAEAIMNDPFAGLTLASKFLPKETNVNVNSTIEMHLNAVRQIVQEGVVQPIKQMTEDELLGD